MTQISAAENLIIQADAGQWRMLAYNDLGEATEVLRATPDGPLSFSANFALTRRLPSAGRLPAKYVRMVVLGWSHDDDSWHLGILLVKELADIRGSRWCEIASWPDPDPNVFQDLAQKSGETLAQILNVKFYVVSPREDEIAAQPELPLPEPPITLGLWRMERKGESRFVFVRSRRWLIGRFLRIGWYSLLAVIYIVLSVATLEQDLALPNSGLMLPTPELLPYLGIVASVVSILIALYTVYELLTAVNRIEINGVPGAIIGYHNHRAKWDEDAKNFRAVYVTHVLKSRRKHIYTDYGEINLLRNDDTFKHLIRQNTDEQELPGQMFTVQDGVQPLRSDRPLTPLQVTGLYLARALGNMPCWYDQRGG